MRLIDADELKKAIMLKEDVAYETWDELYDSVLEEIDNAPTVKFSLMPADETKEDAYKRGYERGEIAGILKANTRPQGEWIRKGDSKWHCSNCGAVPEFDGTTNTDKFNVTMSNKYCRLCGANMRKGGAE